MRLAEEKTCPKCHGEVRFVKKGKPFNDGYEDWPVDEYYCKQCRTKRMYNPENSQWYPTENQKAPNPRLRRQSSRRRGIGFSQ